MSNENKKRFTCSKFQIQTPCSYTVEGDEEKVVNEAENHEIAHHDYEQSPVLRQRIIDSLEDV